MLGCGARATASASARNRARSCGLACDAGTGCVFKCHQPHFSARCSGLVDDAHAAAAQLGQDLIAGDGLRQHLGVCQCPGVGSERIGKGGRRGVAVHLVGRG